VLPGFGLTMGFTLPYLGLIVLRPRAHACRLGGWSDPLPQARRRARGHQPRALRRPGELLLPGGRLRVREGRRRRRPPDHPRAELRALQDLRHQWPDAQHRLGHARGRRRADFRGDGATRAARARDARRPRAA